MKLYDITNQNCFQSAASTWFTHFLEIRSCHLRGLFSVVYPVIKDAASSPAAPVRHDCVWTEAKCECFSITCRHSGKQGYTWMSVSRVASRNLKHLSCCYVKGNTAACIFICISLYVPLSKALLCKSVISFDCKSKQTGLLFITCWQMWQGMKSLKHSVTPSWLLTLLGIPLHSSWCVCSRCSTLTELYSFSSFDRLIDLLLETCSEAVQQVSEFSTCVCVCVCGLFIFLFFYPCICTKWTVVVAGWSV